MRQKNRKIMAVGMAAVTLCTSLVSTPVYAAEASVSVDEAMYVNLDYYGSVDKVNVVKGVSLNGLTSFTDYGNYLDVTNMTNNTAPEIGDGKVTWNLPADTKGYFYYKGHGDTSVDDGCLLQIKRSPDGCREARRSFRTRGGPCDRETERCGERLL